MDLIVGYEFSLRMGWKKIVLSDSEEKAILKLEKHLKHLLVKDGFTIMACKAIENIKNKEYSIKEYDGTIVL